MRACMFGSRKQACSGSMEAGHLGGGNPEPAFGFTLLHNASLPGLGYRTQLKLRKRVYGRADS